MDQSPCGTLRAEVSCSILGVPPQTPEKKDTSRQHRIRKTALLAALLCAGTLASVPAARAQRHINDNVPFRSGSDWNLLQGTVIEFSSNAPVSGIQVTVLASGDRSTVQTLYTDSEGHFRVSVRPGNYQITVQGAGYETTETTVSPDNLTPPLIVSVKRVDPDPGTPANPVVSAINLKAPAKAVKAFEKGVENLDKHQPDKAKEEFQKAIVVYPEYSEAYYRLGLSEIELGDTAAATKDLQKAIDLAKGRHSEAQFAMGALLCQEARFAEALRSIEQGEAVDSISYQGPLFKGQALFGLGRLDEAEAQETEALRRRPAIPLAYLIRANVHIRKHQLTELVEDLDHFLKLQPNGETSARARRTREAALQEIAERSEKELAATKKP
jgi:Tfp pilus assembly protein PilF